MYLRQRHELSGEPTRGAGQRIAKGPAGFVQVGAHAAFAHANWSTRAAVDTLPKMASFERHSAASRAKVGVGVAAVFASDSEEHTAEC
jgi:hypothetical protein